MKNIRFILDELGRVEIRAKRKDNGKYDTLGYVHPATARLMKRDNSISKYSNLIILPPKI